MEDRYLFKGKEKDSEKWLEWNAIAGIPHNVSILTDTICQCTGLKDKNGKLIWESDVVKKEFYTDYDNCANSEEYIGIVKVADCARLVENIRGKCTRSIFEAMSYWEDVKYFEVIGNVFDNPELLEGGE